MADPRLDDPRIKKDVVRVIAQYLEDEGYVSDHPPTHPTHTHTLVCHSLTPTILICQHALTLTPTQSL